jgi:uncharacterized protein YndB with AHSA1/START domain
MKKLIVTTDVPTEIHMTRTFNAPRSLVREAMTKPEFVKKWLGNSRSPLTGIEVDLRVGGRYRYVFTLPDGNTFAITGVYRELSDERVVHTEAMEGQPGESVVTTTFTEQNGRTTLHIVMAFPTQEIRDFVVSTGMADGAGESYDNLEALLAGSPQLSA